MTDDVVRTVGQMLQVVTPVLGEILTTQELAATTLRVIRQPAQHPIPPLKTQSPLQNSDLLDEDTLLELHTFERCWGSWMEGIEPQPTCAHASAAKYMTTSPKALKANQAPAMYDTRQHTMQEIADTRGVSSGTISRHLEGDTTS